MNAALLMVEGAGLVILLALSAFFSSAETALFSLNPIHIHRMRRVRPQAANRVERLLQKPPSLLSTILIGNTLVNVTASALGFVVAETLWPGHGEMVAIPAMTALLLVFGEVAPKRLAMGRAEWLAAHYAAGLLACAKVFLPLRILIERVSVLFRHQLQAEGRTLTEEEFQTVVEVGEEEGVLDEEERVMVDGIIRLEETQAQEIMTPRVDVIGVDLDDPPEVREAVARGVQYRYLPVYRGSLDHAEGFLDVPHYLLDGGGDMTAAMIRPFFVPETVPLDTLLATFQREHRRVALVADEFGGTAGLVTRGDILEEIADAETNEFGDEVPAVQPLGGNRWLVEGQTSLEDLNYELDLDLTAEGADRIAGWVSARLERMPHPGDVVEGQGCRATVQRMRKRRVLQVLVEVLPREARAAEGGAA